MLRSSSPARNLGRLHWGFVQTHRPRSQRRYGVSAPKLLELCTKNDHFEVGKGLVTSERLGSTEDYSFGCTNFPWMPRPNGDEPSHQMISSYLFYVLWRRAVSQWFQPSQQCPKPKIIVRTNSAWLVRISIHTC